MPLSYAKNVLVVSGKEPRFLLPEDIEATLASNPDKTPADETVPFIDDAAMNIITVIGRKGWDIPGVDIEASIIGDIEHPIHCINALRGVHRGQNWEIRFNRHQYNHKDEQWLGMSPSFVKIPAHILEIGGLGKAFYYPYVGDNWFEDEDMSYAEIMDAKGRNEDETAFKRYTWEGGVFRHETGSAPVLDTLDVFTPFDGFLKDIVQELEKLPDADETPYDGWKRRAQLEKKPVPDAIPVLFVTENPSKNNILISGNEQGFCRFYDLDEDMPFSEVALDHFSYGFTAAPLHSQTGLWGRDPLDPDRAVYAVTLKYANDIYVADESVAIGYADYHQIAPGEGDDEQKAEMFEAIAKTLTPLEHYQNNFKNPVYLINRPLGADEACDVTNDIRITNGKTTLEFGPEGEMFVKPVYVLRS